MADYQNYPAPTPTGAPPVYEKVVGVWRRSEFSWGFWWRAISTAGMYLLFYWNRNTITVTTHRVTQHIGGLIGSKEIHMNIEKISDVSLDMPALGSIFNYGTVRIQSSGSDNNDIYFKGLGSVRALRDAIFQLQDQMNVYRK